MSEDQYNNLPEEDQYEDEYLDLSEDEDGAEFIGQGEFVEGTKEFLESTHDIDSTFYDVKYLDKERSSLFSEAIESGRVRSSILNIGNIFSAHAQDPKTEAQSTLETLDSAKRVEEYLLKNKVAANLYSSPMRNERLHAKLYIGTNEAKQREALVSTGNPSPRTLQIIPHSLQERRATNKKYNYDLSVRIRDKQTVMDLQSTYNELKGGLVPKSRGAVKIGGDASNAIARTLGSRKADEIIVTSPYIDDPLIGAALSEAKNKGARVTLVTSNLATGAGTIEGRQNLYNRLVASGVTILTPRADDPLKEIHSKSLLIKSGNSVTTYIGSHNLTRAAKEFESIDLMVGVKGDVNSSLYGELKGLTTNYDLVTYKGNRAPAFGKTERRMYLQGTGSLYRIPTTQVSTAKGSGYKSDSIGSIPFYPIDLGKEHFQAFKGRPLPQVNTFSNLYRARTGQSSPYWVKRLDQQVSSPPMGESINRALGLEVYHKEYGVIGSAIKSFARGLDFLFGQEEFERARLDERTSDKSTFGSWVTGKYPKSKDEEGFFEFSTSTLYNLASGLAVAAGTYVGFNLPIRHVIGMLEQEVYDFVLTPTTSFNNDLRGNIARRALNTSRKLMFGQTYGELYNTLTAISDTELMVARNLGKFHSGELNAITSDVDQLSTLTRLRSSIYGQDGQQKLQLGDEFSLLGISNFFRRFDSLRFSKVIRPILEAINPYPLNVKGGSAYAVYQESLLELEKLLSAPPEVVYKNANNQPVHKLQFANIGYERTMQTAKAMDRIGALLPLNIFYWVPGIRKTFNLPQFDPTEHLTWRSVFSFEEASDWVTANLRFIGDKLGVKWRATGSQGLGRLGDVFQIVKGIFPSVARTFKDATNLYKVAKEYRKEFSALKNALDSNPIHNILDKNVNLPIPEVDPDNTMGALSDAYSELRSKFEAASSYVDAQESDIKGLEQSQQKLYGLTREYGYMVGVDKSLADEITHPLAESTRNPNVKVQAPHLIPAPDSPVALRAAKFRSFAKLAGLVLLTDSLLDFSILNNGVDLFTQLFAKRELGKEDVIADFKYQGNLPSPLVLGLGLGAGATAGFLFPRLQAGEDLLPSGRVSAPFGGTSDSPIRKFTWGLAEQVGPDKPILVPPTEKKALEVSYETFSEKVTRRLGGFKNIRMKFNYTLGWGVTLMTALLAKLTSQGIASLLNPSSPELDQSAAVQSAIFEDAAITASLNKDYYQAGMLNLLAADHLKTVKLGNRVYSMATQTPTPFIQLAALARVEPTEKRIALGIGFQLTPALGLGISPLLPFSIKLGPSKLRQDQQQFYTGDLTLIDSLFIGTNLITAPLTGGSNLAYEPDSGYVSALEYIGMSSLLASTANTVGRLPVVQQQLKPLTKYDGALVRGGFSLVTNLPANLATLPLHFVGSSYSALQEAIGFKHLGVATLGIIAAASALNYLDSGGIPDAGVAALGLGTMGALAFAPNSFNRLARLKPLGRAALPYYVAYTAGRLISDPEASYKGAHTSGLSEQTQATIGITAFLGSSLAASGAFWSREDIFNAYSSQLTSQKERELIKAILIGKTENSTTMVDAIDKALIEIGTTSSGSRPLPNVDRQTQRELVSAQLWEDVLSRLPRITGDATLDTDPLRRRNLDFVSLRARLKASGRAVAISTLALTALAYLSPSFLADVLEKTPIVGPTLKVFSGRKDSQPFESRRADPGAFFQRALSMLTLNWSKQGIYTDRPDPYFADPFGIFGRSFKPHPSPYAQLATEMSDLSASAYTISRTKLSNPDIYKLLLTSNSKDPATLLALYRGGSLRKSKLRVSNPLTSYESSRASSLITQELIRRKFLTDNLAWQRSEELLFDLRAEMLRTGMIGNEINPNYRIDPIWSPLMGLSSAQFFTINLAAHESLMGGSGSKSALKEMEKRIYRDRLIEQAFSPSDIFKGIVANTVGLDPRITAGILTPLIAGAYIYGLTQMTASVVQLGRTRTPMQLTEDLEAISSRNALNHKEYRFMIKKIDGKNRLVQVTNRSGSLGYILPLDVDYVATKMGSARSPIAVGQAVATSYGVLAEGVNSYFKETFRDLLTTHLDNPTQLKQKVHETLSSQLKHLLKKKITDKANISIFEALFSGQDADRFVDFILGAPDKGLVSDLIDDIQIHPSLPPDHRRLLTLNRLHSSPHLKRFISIFQFPNGALISTLPDQTDIPIAQAERSLIGILKSKAKANTEATWLERALRKSTLFNSGLVNAVSGYQMFVVPAYEITEGLSLAWDTGQPNSMRKAGATTALMSASTQLTAQVAQTSFRSFLSGFMAGGIKRNLLIGGLTVGVLFGLEYLKKAFPGLRKTEQKLYRSTSALLTNPVNTIGNFFDNFRLGTPARILTNVIATPFSWIAQLVTRPINWFTSQVTGPLLSKLSNNLYDSWWGKGLLFLNFIPMTAYSYDYQKQLSAYMYTREYIKSSMRLDPLPPIEILHPALLGGRDALFDDRQASLFKSYAGTGRVLDPFNSGAYRISNLLLMALKRKHQMGQQAVSIGMIDRLQPPPINPLMAVGAALGFLASSVLMNKIMRFGVLGKLTSKVDGLLSRIPIVKHGARILFGSEFAAKREVATLMSQFDADDLFGTYKAPPEVDTISTPKQSYYHRTEHKLVFSKRTTDTLSRINRGLRVNQSRRLEAQFEVFHEYAHSRGDIQGEQFIRELSDPLDVQTYRSYDPSRLTPAQLEDVNLRSEKSTLDYVKDALEKGHVVSREEMLLVYQEEVRANTVAYLTTKSSDVIGQTVNVSQEYNEVLNDPLRPLGNADSAISRDRLYSSSIDKQTLRFYKNLRKEFINVVPKMSQEILEVGLDVKKILKGALTALDLGFTYIDVTSAFDATQEWKKNVLSNRLTKESLVKARAKEFSAYIGSVGGSLTQLLTKNFFISLAVGGTLSVIGGMKTPFGDIPAVSKDWFGIATWFADRDREKLARGETPDPYAPTMGIYPKLNLDDTPSSYTIRYALRPMVKNALRYGLASGFAYMGTRALLEGSKSWHERILDSAPYMMASILTAAPIRTVDSFTKRVSPARYGISAFLAYRSFEATRREHYSEAFFSGLGALSLIDPRTTAKLGFTAVELGVKGGTSASKLSLKLAKVATKITPEFLRTSGKNIFKTSTNLIKHLRKHSRVYGTAAIFTSTLAYLLYGDSAEATISEGLYRVSGKQVDLRGKGYYYDPIVYSSLGYLSYRLHRRTLQTHIRPNVKPIIRFGKYLLSLGASTLKTGLTGIASVFNKSRPIFSFVSNLVSKTSSFVSNAFKGLKTYVGNTFKTIKNNIWILPFSGLKSILNRQINAPLAFRYTAQLGISSYLAHDGISSLDALSIGGIGAINSTLSGIRLSKSIRNRLTTHYRRNLHLKGQLNRSQFNKRRRLIGLGTNVSFSLASIITNSVFTSYTEQQLTGKDFDWGTFTKVAASQTAFSLVIPKAMPLLETMLSNVIPLTSSVATGLKSFGEKVIKYPYNQLRTPGASQAFRYGASSLLTVGLAIDGVSNYEALALGVISGLNSTIETKALQQYIDTRTPLTSLRARKYIGGKSPTFFGRRKARLISRVGRLSTLTSAIASGLLAMGSESMWEQKDPDWWTFAKVAGVHTVTATAVPIVNTLLKGTGKGLRKLSKLAAIMARRFDRASALIATKVSPRLGVYIGVHGIRDSALRAVGSALDLGFYGLSLFDLARGDRMTDKQLAMTYKSLYFQQNSIVGGVLGGRAFGITGDIFASVALPLISRPSEDFIKERVRLKETGIPAVLQYGVRPLIYNSYIAELVGTSISDRLLPAIGKSLDAYSRSTLRATRGLDSYRQLLGLKWYQSPTVARTIAWSKLQWLKGIRETSRVIAPRLRWLEKMGFNGTVASSIFKNDETLKALSSQKVARGTGQIPMIARLGRILNPLGSASKWLVETMGPALDIAIGTVITGFGVKDTWESKTSTQLERGQVRTFSGVYMTAGALIGGAMFGPLGAIAGGILAERVGNQMGKLMAQRAKAANVNTKNLALAQVGGVVGGALLGAATAFGLIAAGVALPVIAVAALIGGAAALGLTAISWLFTRKPKPRNTLKEKPQALRKQPAKETLIASDTSVVSDVPIGYLEPTNIDRTRTSQLAQVERAEAKDEEVNKEQVPWWKAAWGGFTKGLSFILKSSLEFAKSGYDLATRTIRVTGQIIGEVTGKLSRGITNFSTGVNKTWNRAATIINETVLPQGLQIPTSSNASKGNFKPVGISPNATSKQRALIQAANEIGLAPEELAAIISWETGGTFSPSQRRHDGGNYLGLIQFGPSERKKYGVHAGQSFEQQMKAVERYFKDRGFKPGMGLLKAYATVLGGNPNANIFRKDAFGTSPYSAFISKISPGKPHYISGQKFLGNSVVRGETTSKLVVQTTRPASKPLNVNATNIGNLPIKNNQIVLTFDDGPDPNWTPKILDVLKKNKVKATFFVVGSRAAQHPEIIKRIIAEGHEIGIHSNTHPDYTKLNPSQRQEETERTRQIIKSIVPGYEPKVMRFPYGAGSYQNQELYQREQNRLGLSTVYWSSDTNDWRKTTSSSQIASEILRAGGGDIILMHDALDIKGHPSATRSKQAVVDALSVALPELTRRGIKGVTFSDAFGLNNQTVKVVSETPNIPSLNASTVSPVGLTTSDSQSTLVPTYNPRAWTLASFAGNTNKRVRSFAEVPLHHPLKERQNLRKTPITGDLNYMRDYNIGKGNSVIGYQGAPIIAAADGTVIYSGWMRGYGNTVIVKLDGGGSVLMGHMVSLNVKKGQRVGTGTLIGGQGTTGNSTGVHLHMEAPQWYHENWIKGMNNGFKFTPTNPYLFNAQSSIDSYNRTGDRGRLQDAIINLERYKASLTNKAKIAEVDAEIARIRSASKGKVNTVVNHSTPSPSNTTVTPPTPPVRSSPTVSNPKPGNTNQSGIVNPRPITPKKKVLRIEDPKKRGVVEDRNQRPEYHRWKKGDPEGFQEEFERQMQEQRNLYNRQSNVEAGEKYAYVVEEQVIQQNQVKVITPPRALKTYISKTTSSPSDLNSPVPPPPSVKGKATQQGNKVAIHIEDESHNVAMASALMNGQVPMMMY